MNRAIGAALVAFLLALLGGKALIPLLRRLKFGQQIYELGPKTHQIKQGTPTMGGITICIAALLSMALLRVGTTGIPLRSDPMLAAAVFCLLNLCIGATDDLLKILRKGNNRGLSPKQKLIPQTLFALLFACYCYFHPEIGSAIRIPFWKQSFDLGILYIPFAVFVIVATTNCANLLDGLDGLLGSVSLLDMVTFGAIALLLPLSSTISSPMSIFSFAIAGACLGFLRYNTHPAMLFMGDTGSMFLGGAVCAIALTTGTALLIPIAGLMMALSGLSVAMQRLYCRRTGGKRIFLSSPLHHHFELKGMAETRIVSMYSIVTVALCLFSLLVI